MKTYHHLWFYFTFCFFSSSPMLESCVVFLFHPTLFTVFSSLCSVLSVLLCICSVQRNKSNSFASWISSSLPSSPCWTGAWYNRKSRLWNGLSWGALSLKQLCFTPVLPILCLCWFDTLIKWLNLKSSQCLKIWSAPTVHFSEGNWVCPKQ